MAVNIFGPEQGRQTASGETWGPTLAARAVAAAVSLLLIVLLWMLSFRNSAETCQFTLSSPCVVHPAGSDDPPDTVTDRLEPSEQQGH